MNKTNKTNQMKYKLLFVDDEQSILDAFKRQFYNIYTIDTAVSGSIALDKIIKNGHYSVIVSDYKMHGMNGLEFLEKAKEISPDSVRIMLSGQAEFEALVNVVNKGKIFRFLNKPCSSDDLSVNIKDAITQYELIHAEKVLLEKTLSGSIKLLIDIISMLKPSAFEKVQRLRVIIKKYTDKMNITHTWQYEISSLLCKIGWINIPDEILKRVLAGETINDSERLVFERYPSAGVEMLKNIPRIEGLLPIILNQEKNFNGSGFPQSDLSGKEIPIISRLLKISNDYDTLISNGKENITALSILKSRAAHGVYDPEILDNFVKCFSGTRKYIKTAIAPEKLLDDMIIGEDILSQANGELIAKKGQLVSMPLKSRLIGLKKLGRVDTVMIIQLVEDDL